ncbi:MAG: ABC transporter permease [Alphaproteobacteria bacterium]|nr:MAG: ABC transporter permease [Alphaproteobacteria bacterium]
MDSWRKNPVVFWALNLPPTIWLVVFFIIPLGLIWVISFGEKRGVVDIEITWTLDNYLRALDPLYLGIFWKSIWMAFLATVVCLIVGYPVAFAIAFAPSRWKPLLLLGLMVPFWINILIRTYALIAVFRTRGYVNFTLEWLWEKAHAALTLIGIDPTWLLGARFDPLQLLYNNFAVNLGIVYAFFPFMVLPLYANIEKLDRTYMEASLDLGAGHWRTFISVVLPLTWHGALSGIIIVFIPALGAFFIPDLLGGTDSQLIGNVIERQFKSANDWPFGAALSFLLMYATFGALALRSLIAGRKQGLEI